MSLINRERLLGLARHALTWLGGSFVGKGWLSNNELEIWVGALIAIFASLWGVFAPNKAALATPKRVRVFSAVRHSLTTAGGVVIAMGWASADLVNAIAAGVVQFLAVAWSLDSPEKRL